MKNIKPTSAVFPGATSWTEIPPHGRCDLAAANESGMRRAWPRCHFVCQVWCEPAGGAPRAQLPQLQTWGQRSAKSRLKSRTVSQPWKCPTCQRSAVSCTSAVCDGLTFSEAQIVGLIIASDILVAWSGFSNASAHLFQPVKCQLLGPPGPWVGGCFDSINEINSRWSCETFPLFFAFFFASYYYARKHLETADKGGDN